MDLFSIIGTNLMVILYFSVARDRMRRVEIKVQRRAARRIAA